MKSSLISLRSPQLSASVVSLLFIFSCADRDAAMRDYKSAGAAFQKRDFNAAAFLLERAIKNDPAFLPPYKGLLQLRRGLSEMAALKAFSARASSSIRKHLKGAATAMIPSFLKSGEKLLKAKKKRAALEDYRRSARLLEATGLQCAAGILYGRAAHAAYELPNFKLGVRLLETAFERCLSEKQERVATTYLKRIAFYKKIDGDFEGSFAALVRLEAIWRSLGERREIAETLSAQTTELTSLGRWDDADAKFDEALRIAITLKDRVLEADILMTGANACGHRSDYDCALTRARQAVAMREALGDQKKLAVAMGDLGKLLSSAGHLDEAIKTLERVAAMEEKAKDFTGLAGTQVNLGAAYREKGDPVRALALYRKAEAEFAKLPAFARFRAVAIANIGNTYLALGLPEKALEHHERALRIKRRVANKRELAQSLFDLARVLSSLRKYAVARRRAEEALRLYTAIEDAAARAEVEVFLSTLAAQEGRRSDSRSLLDKAIATQERLNLSGALVTSRFMRAIHHLEYDNDPAAAARELDLARKLSVSRGAPMEHLELLVTAAVKRKQGDRQGALAALKRIAAILDEQRDLLKADEFKMSFLANAANVHREIADLTLETAGGSAAGIASAFEALERQKARMLLDWLTSRGTAWTGGRTGEAALLDRERIASRYLALVQKRIASLMGRTASARDAARVTALEARRKKLLDEVDTLRAEIKAANPLVAMPTRAPALNVSALQRDHLGQSETLLVYSVGRADTLLIVATKDRLATHRLAVPASALESRVTAYRDSYLLQREIMRPKAFIRDGLALYRDLLGAVDPSLVAAGRDLIIVPDGPLAALPFEALIVDGDADQKRKTYLIERNVVSYVPSASVLVALHEREKKHPPARTGFFAVGDPVYDFAAFSRGAPEAAIEGATRSRALATVAWDGPLLTRLPSTASEVERISALFDPGASHLFLRGEARESVVKSPRLRQNRFVHFASHGLLADNFQALALTFDPKDADDGFLELREIQGLSLNAEAVVLSACQTGSGRYVSGEGVVGLTHAFLFAGAPRVVVSLWSVGDESTSELMVEMYRRFGPPGAPRVAHALRDAKLALLRGAPAHAAPFFWAPFVTIGM